MKRKPDWAAEYAWVIVRGCAAPRDPDLADLIARALRAAERRGFMRAVKMLRNIGFCPHAAWLEEQR